jgi:hypothetical protein
LQAGITAATSTGAKEVLETKAMDAATRERYREAAKEMFYHSYNSYLQHAFPKDELAPISCKVRSVSFKEMLPYITLIVSKTVILIPNGGECKTQLAGA